MGTASRIATMQALQTVMFWLTSPTADFGVKLQGVKIMATRPPGLGEPHPVSCIVDRYVNCQIEAAYRRGFSQGVAQAAYAEKAGATSAELEQFRRDVMKWRMGVSAFGERTVKQIEPPLIRRWYK